VEPAHDEIADALVELWKQSLRTERVDLHTSFFALGGNSMTAIRMLSTALSRYGVDIDLPTFFETPTITTLAALLHGQLAVQSGSGHGG
jgi:acyl carrier protein